MNAKQLFSKSKKVTEADETPVPPGHSPGTPPPGRQYPPLPRSRRAPGGQDAKYPDPRGVPDMERVMGREEAPKGQFSSKELSQLKDVMIFILAGMLGSDLDKQIGQALATGQPLDPGQLQHIMDEARRFEIPESHGPLMQKIFSQIGQ